MLPLLSSLIDFTLPKKCLCGEKFSEQQGAICAECFSETKFSSEQNCCKLCSFPFEYELGGSNNICSDCIAETPIFDRLRYVFSYNEFTGKVIKNFKYKDGTYSTNSLVKLLKNKALEFDNIDVICSVPITGKRLRARKYNQSALLAKKLAESLNIDCNNLLLKKIKETKVQAGLSKKERKLNLKNSFAVNTKQAKALKAKNILIIDDVYTTGTTMNECAKTLKNQIEDCKIYGLVLARVFKD